MSRLAINPVFQSSLYLPIVALSHHTTFSRRSIMFSDAAAITPFDSSDVEIALVIGKDRF